MKRTFLATVGFNVWNKVLRFKWKKNGKTFSILIQHPEFQFKVGEKGLDYKFFDEFEHKLQIYEEKDVPKFTVHTVIDFTRNPLKLPNGAKLVKANCLISFNSEGDSKFESQEQSVVEFMRELSEFFTKDFRYVFNGIERFSSYLRLNVQE